MGRTETVDYAILLSGECDLSPQHVRNGS
jgi:hypothetical protein